MLSSSPELCQDNYSDKIVSLFKLCDNSLTYIRNFSHKQCFIHNNCKRKQKKLTNTRTRRSIKSKKKLIFCQFAAKMITQEIYKYIGTTKYEDTYYAN